ncbi:MAG TPA: hypothetical protein VNI77_01160, partial [Nitrososphaera sp.]|nr:hypothetical protein [Nitrososphaera sp.]
SVDSGCAKHAHVFWRCEPAMVTTGRTPCMYSPHLSPDQCVMYTKMDSSCTATTMNPSGR